METEVKWIFIGFILVMLIIVFGESYGHYQQNQCRIAAMQANVPVVDIEKVCK